MGRPNQAIPALSEHSRCVCGDQERRKFKPAFKEVCLFSIKSQPEAGRPGSFTRRRRPVEGLLLVRLLQGKAVEPIPPPQSHKCKGNREVTSQERLF